jgi:hypothetical protein
MLFGMILSAATRSAGSTERLSQSARGRSSRAGTSVRQVLLLVNKVVPARRFYALDDSEPEARLDELFYVILFHVSIDDRGTRVVCNVCDLSQFH